MLVRIQLGQQANPGAKAPGFLFSRRNQACLRRGVKIKIQHTKGVLDLLEH
jgi:hypothetical protein